MIREKGLLLQVEDEGSDLVRPYRGDVGAGAVRQQEFPEIMDAVGDDLDRLNAFALGGGAQLVPF
jgi:hypothetical protein